MVPRTRRQFLSFCAGTAAAAVAGCSSSDSDRSPPPEAPTFPDEEDLVMDPPTYTTRMDVDIDTGDSLLTHDNESIAGSLGTYIVDAEAVEGIRFRHRPPDADGALAFLRETDYDEATVVIEDMVVGACHRWALQYVELRGERGFSTEFCRVMREPSVACSVAEEHHQLTLARVPVAYEQAPREYGGGRDNDCELPPGHPAGGGDAE